jgi:deazaflavin-dependent oxidoreductase (nitroreductase family)
MLNPVSSGYLIPLFRHQKIVPLSQGHSPLCRILQAPAYLYHWHLGILLGRRFLLLDHVGRRTSKLHHTVLEVLDYRREISEAVVMSGFGWNSDWLRNIEANHAEEITLASHHFAAIHRFLGEQEAVKVMECYERRNRFILPIVRLVLGRLMGTGYNSSEADRRRLVTVLPLLAFRPRP